MSDYFMISQIKSKIDDTERRLAERIKVLERKVDDLLEAVRSLTPEPPQNNE